MRRIFLIWCLSLFIGGVYAQEKMAEIALSLPGGHVSGVALELNERIVEQYGIACTEIEETKFI